MLDLRTLFILCGVWTVNAASDLPEGHSLTYIYTAFTKPVDLPGIYEFTAIGQLDGRAIDYYNSDKKIKEPKEKWMKDRVEKGYWDTGTRSRQTKQQWFKVNLDILNDRFKKNNTENHVLQWRHGCQVSGEGSDKIITGTDEYSYDGMDFLSFDSSNKQWVAPRMEAVVTKRKWDGIQQLNVYTDGYLHNECVKWLDTFVKYRTEADTGAVKPEIYVYAKPFKNHLKLSCLATGFYPKEISLDIKRDGVKLDSSDGLMSTGVRPNGDGTHQIKKWVEILETDKAKYTCEVNHPATNIFKVKEWDHMVTDPSSNTGVIVGVAIGVVVLLVIGVVVGVFVYKKRNVPGEPKVDAKQVKPLLAVVVGEPKAIDNGSVSSDDSGILQPKADANEGNQLLPGDVEGPKTISNGSVSSGDSGNKSGSISSVDTGMV